MNWDIPEFAILAKAAHEAGMGSFLTFGEGIDADFRLIAYELFADGSVVSALTPVGSVTYRLGVPGKHWVMNSLCVLAAAHGAGADVVKAAESLCDLRAPSGRGEQFEVSIAEGCFKLIDESYNASPEAVSASLAVLGEQPVGENGRRIAVLGDMLEMGDDSPRMHAEIAQVLEETSIDQVFLAGEAMRHLWDELPKSLRAHHAVSSGALNEVVCKAVRPGDVVMVKGSAGMHMGQLVSALKSLDTSNQTKGEV